MSIVKNLKELEDFKTNVLTSLFWVNRIKQDPSNPTNVVSPDDSLDYPTLAAETLTKTYAIIDQLTQQLEDSLEIE